MLVRPDGAKIAELRNAKGLKQKALAESARISERSLREIEKRNHPLREHKLLELAKHLQTSIEDIKAKESLGGNVAPPAGKTPKKPSDPHKLELHPAEKANELWNLARRASKCNYMLMVEPTAKTAPLLEEVLVIVQRAYTITEDDYDRSHRYPNFHRLARLNEILGELSENGIGVLANTNWCWCQDAAGEMKHKSELYVSFSPIERKSELVSVNLDLDRDPATGEWKEKTMDLDDDIQF